MLSANARVILTLLGSGVLIPAGAPRHVRVPLQAEPCVSPVNFTAMQRT